MLQLSEEDNHPPFIGGQEQTNMSCSTEYTSKKFDENLHQQKQYYLDIGINHKKKDSPVEKLKLWSQNMQELGLCEELVCHEIFDIPDVDLTF
ncbi:Zinc finger, B-box [Quillaja saponaria]|uniref:Zinc finger, B-box n=1 Tax=Quillaja saponaria TaxID=32244 RepID=A0AAD7L9L3_QUISA|nr:Zinc finger, B-box [Quillaja saponaria]